MTRHFPAAWPCALLAIVTAEALAYTEITVKTIDALRLNGGNWSALSSEWRNYDDSDSELTAMYDRNSIFYKDIPRVYEPLVGTTNTTVTYYSTQTKIAETYKTGWVLVESGKTGQNWYKVFSITNSTFYSDYLLYNGGTPSLLTEHTIDAFIVTIYKSSGMPKNPSWLAGVADGPDSKVLVETQYPVTCGWLRTYFPSQPYANLKSCAESVAPNGMPYYIAAMMKYDPADPNDRFGISLEFEDGKPRPRVDIRSYRFQNYGFIIDVNCKKELTDPEWTVCTEYSEAEVYNFFKAVIRNTQE